MSSTEFTPVAAVAGGLLIGLASVVLMYATGRIAGISGIVSRLLPPYTDNQWQPRLAFVLGLLVAPLLYAAATGVEVAHSVTTSVPALVAGGLLVGIGTVTGGGCTSGHGVCGLARFSARSLVATLTFMAAAIVTVFAVRHIVGG